MKRVVLLFLLMFFIGLVAARSFRQVKAEDRYATCDLCGYCEGGNIPGGWADCSKCLYGEGATIDSTRLVDPETNLQTQPTPGRQYTFLGCLSSDFGSFQQGGGAVFQSIIKIVLSAAGGIAFLYLIYGAFVIITSQDDPERLNYGRRVVYGSIVGLIFSLGSVLIINLVAGQILRIPWFGSSP